MATKQIDLTRSSTFGVFVDYLSSLGVPTDKPLRIHRLPDMRLLDDEWAFLPRANCLSFLEDMVRREGIDDLALRAWEHRLPFLPLKTCTTLLSALQEALLLFSNVQPSVSSSMTLSGDVARISLKILCNQYTEGIAISSWAMILQLVALVRQAGADTWTPKRVGVRGNGTIPDYTREYFAGTEFIPDLDSYWFEIPVQTLSLPLSNSGARSLQLQPSDQIGWRLKYLMRSYLSEGDMGLSRLCDATNFSRRTIQRRLALEGLDYRQMLQGVRYEVACDMLAQPELKIMEISECLGYSTPAHFSRAFRRTGCSTPTQYRQGLYSQAG